ncbi:diacylglycerol kinase family lipid kinase [soil metagenome]
MTNTSALVIMNPVSGQKDHDSLRAKIEEHLKAAGVEYELRETAGEGDAKAWAEAADTDLVLVYGGDGTVMETMTGLINNERDIPLAQLPGGTANLLARALGIPVDIEEALEVALGGVAVPLDVGYLPEKDLYFSLVAGAGWDASLIEDASREIKNRLGFFAYVVTGVKNLYNLKRSHITLEIDGEKHQFRAHTVMLVNVGEILGTGFALGKDMSPHDGKLNLAVASPNSFGGIAKLVFRLATNRFENYRDLQYFSGCEVRVEANPPLKLELDGEAVGETPFSARVVPGCALLLVPREYAEAKNLTDARPVAEVGQD